MKTILRLGLTAIGLGACGLEGRQTLMEPHMLRLYRARPHRIHDGG